MRAASYWNWQNTLAQFGPTLKNSKNKLTGLKKWPAHDDINVYEDVSPALGVEFPLGWNKCAMLEDLPELATQNFYSYESYPVDDWINEVKVFALFDF